MTAHDFGRFIKRGTSISRTTDESQERAINSDFATGGVGAALMIAMKSSIFASATAKPSNT